jgi:hypothetical protein
MTAIAIIEYLIISVFCTYAAIEPGGMRKGWAFIFGMFWPIFITGFLISKIFEK